METFITEQELNEFKEGKASAAVAEKLTLLTKQNFVPQSRLNEVVKEKDQFKTELDTVKPKLADFDKVSTEAKQHADNLKKVTDDLTKAKNDFDTEQKNHATLKTEFESVKKTADAYGEFKKTQVEEAKKLLGDKWLDEFATFELPKLSKIVGDMTGQKMATSFTPPGNRSGQGSVVSGRSKIAEGLTKK